MISITLLRLIYTVITVDMCLGLQALWDMGRCPGLGACRRSCVCYNTS